MKIIRIILFVLLVQVNFTVFSVEDVLIDFSDIGDTTIDFSKFTRGDWTPEQFAHMKVDLHPSRWNVVVNYSSFDVESRNKTYPMLVTTNIKSLSNQQVLAARVFFPQKYAHSNVFISPPFEIPSFYIDTENNPDDFMGTMFLNKGVIRNVGIIRKIGVYLCGHNFNYALYVRVKDQRGIERDLFIGYMNFRGWQKRSWVNPDYDKHLRLREIYEKVRPYYPDEYPYIKLMGFYINRISTEVTGNFVTMIKEVTVEYDEEFVDIKTSDGDDLIPSVMNQEKLFGVYQEELIRRSNKEIARVNEFLMIQWVERNKMDVPKR